MEIKSNFNYDLMSTISNSSGIHGHLNLNHQNLRLTASVPILTSSHQQQDHHHQQQQIQNLLRNSTSNRTGGENINDGNLTSIPPHLLQNLQQESVDSDSRPHICQLCRASYKTRTHLRRHMYIHLSNRPFPCPHDGCSKGFNRKEHLNKHIEAVHSGTKYKCHFCSKEISRKDHLSRHIKNIHCAPQVNKGNDLQALKPEANCNSGGSNKQAKAQAQAQLSFVTPAPVSFSTSNRQQQQNHNTTAKQSKVNRHNIHNNNSNNVNGSTTLQLQYIVNNSGGSGNNNNNMLIQNIPITQVQLNNQNAATKTSQSSQSQHRNNTNNMLTVNGVVNYQQQQQNLKSLNQNSKSEKIDKPQPYKCQECPRAYTRREKLTEHIRCFHQGQKFACEYCHKELSRKDHVLRHVRSVHPEVLANRFVAIAESGGLDQNVNQNQMNVQGGSQQQQQQQQNNSQQGGNSRNSTNIPSMGEMGVLLRSVCHICLKVFGTSYHLSRHMESLHNGDVRPYACTACSKQFKRKDHLTKHIKSHCASMRDTTLSSTSVSRKSVGVRPNTNNNNSSQNSNTNSVSGGGIHHQNLDGDFGSLPIESLPLQIEMMDEEGHSVDSSNDQDPSSRNKSDSDTERDFNMAVSSFLGESTKNMMEKNLSNALLSSSGNSTLQQQHQQQQHQINNGLLISAANTILNQPNPPNSTNNSSSNNNSIINLPNFSCGHCNESFLDRAKLITHLNQHSNEMPTTGGGNGNIWTH